MKKEVESYIRMLGIISAEPKRPWWWKGPPYLGGGQRNCLHDELDIRPLWQEEAGTAVSGVGKALYTKISEHFIKAVTPRGFLCPLPLLQIP